MINGPEWRDADGIRVATAGSSGAQREILLFMGMLASIGPAELHRCALLAAEWNARVTVVDVPGCGRGNARLTKADRSGLRRGDFAPLARRMVRSAQDVNPNLLRRRTFLVGYSLGASLAAAAAADAGLLHVGQLALVEAVALERWNPLNLLRTVRKEDRATAAVSDAFLEQGVAPPRGELALLGYALSRGWLTSDVVRANSLHDLRVQLVRGYDSSLCRRPASERAARFMRRNGVEVSQLAMPGRHGLWHNEADVSELAQLMLDDWPGSARLLPT